MSPILCVFALFLLSAQGEERELTSQTATLRKDHSALGGAMKSWIMATAVEIQNGINDKVLSLNNTIEASKSKAHNELLKKYEDSRLQLKAIEAPQVCLDGADHILQKAKKEGVHNFFMCTNLSIAAEDIVAIGYESGSLIISLFLTADEILNGFGRCFSWNPVKLVYCTYTWIKEAISSLIGTFSQLANFGKKISSLVEDIRAQIKYCSNETSADVEPSKIKALTHLHECSRDAKQFKR